MRQYTRFASYCVVNFRKLLACLYGAWIGIYLSNQEINGHGRGKEPGGKLRHKIRD